MKLLDSPQLIEKIPEETRQNLYKEHMRVLFTTRVKDFRDLLDETRLGPKARWE